MDVYAYLLYIDKSEYDKLSTLEKYDQEEAFLNLFLLNSGWLFALLRLANDMHQVSVNIPETWTVIGYYSLKKKSQKAKCFAENVNFFSYLNLCVHMAFKLNCAQNRLFW